MLKYQRSCNLRFLAVVFVASILAGPFSCAQSLHPGSLSPPSGRTAANSSAEFLSGVWAVSAKSVWAVGSKNGTISVKHRIGTRWADITIAAPTGVGSLEAISGTSDNDIWAVGLHTSGTHSLPLVEHWDGTNWSEVSTPAVAGSDTSGLLGVRAISKVDAWAVGSRRQAVAGTFRYAPLVEHWNGTSWVIVSVPNPLNNSNLMAVDAAGANNIWAVGQTLSVPARPIAIHWDGKTWSEVTVPHDSDPAFLQAIKVIASADIWAVGFSLAPGNGNYSLHYDGNTWTRVSVPSPDPQSSILNAVDGTSTKDVWAVGTLGPAQHTFIGHWDGAKWSRVASPDYSANSLSGISIASGNDIWAVGDRVVSRGPGIIVHWNGRDWSRDTPRVGSTRLLTCDAYTISAKSQDLSNICPPSK
jgi:hypothetical protein